MVFIFLVLQGDKSGGWCKSTVGLDTYQPIAYVRTNLKENLLLRIDYFKYFFIN